MDRKDVEQARKALRSYYEFIMLISPPTIFDVLAVDTMSDEDVLKAAREHNLI